MKPKWSKVQDSLRTLALEGTASVRYFGESEAAAAKLFVRVPYNKINGALVAGGAMWNADLSVILKISEGAEVHVAFDGDGLHLRGSAYVHQHRGFTKLIGANALEGLAEAGFFPPPER